MDGIYTAKMSSKNQVVLPRKVREKLGLQPNMQVHFAIRKGRVELIAPKVSWAEASLGIGKDLRKLADPEKFLDSLRDEWTD